MNLSVCFSVNLCVPVNTTHNMYVLLHDRDSNGLFGKAAAVHPVASSATD